MTDDDLTCRQLVELVTEYLDQALTEQDRQRFEDHLSRCGACRDYMEQSERAIVATRAVAVAPLDQQRRDALLTLYRAWRSAAQPAPAINAGEADPAAL